MLGTLLNSVARAAPARFVRSVVDRPGATPTWGDMMGSVVAKIENTSTPVPSQMGYTEVGVSEWVGASATIAMSIPETGDGLNAASAEVELAGEAVGGP